MTKKELLNLIAEGKTKRVLVELQDLTANDIDLCNEVIQISARYAENEQKERLRIEKQEDLTIEKNRINSAIITIIDKLPDDSLRKKRSPSWEKIAFWLTILAVAAGFTGYTTIKNFFGKKGNPEIIVDPDPGGIGIDTMETKPPYVPPEKPPIRDSSGIPIDIIVASP